MKSAKQQLEQLRREAYKAKHGKEVHRFFESEMKVKSPRTAAQLESLICEYIELSGGVCTKVTTSGRRIVNKTPVKDVTGRQRTLIEDKWVPGTTTPGTSDLIASIPGVKGAVYIEVKMPGDRMRETQVKFQQKVVARGFKYMIAESLEDVVDLI